MVINTGVMYFKMFITIILSLYIARIMLEVLGVLDYGIYNIVAGVVTMFSFLDSSMATATQRFITFELGKKSGANLQKVFSASLYSHIILSIIIFIIVEVVGFWFFDKFINVPVDRLSAAKFVFHFSLLTLICNLLVSPYRALMNAYERMVLIAIMDIINTLMKLGILFLLIYINKDNLRVYGVLVFVVSLFTLLVFLFIARNKYSESKLIKVRDSVLFKDIFSFGMYKLMGSLSNVGVNQGYAILLNVFFGPIMNAAFGIANQVNGQLRNFANNIIIAVNPQLVKRYAAGQKSEMMKLTFQSSKFAFFALLIITTPVLFEMNNLLNLWLTTVPENTGIICQLIIVGALIDVIAQPTMTIIEATGRIKKYQVVTGIIVLLNVPISYLFLKMNFSFHVIFFVYIFISVVVFYIRLLYAKKLVDLNIKDYLKSVVLSVMIVSIFNVVLIFAMEYLLRNSSGWFLFYRLTLCIIISSVIIYQFGLTSIERKYIITKVVNPIFGSNIK